MATNEKYRATGGARLVLLTAFVAALALPAQAWAQATIQASRGPEAGTRVRVTLDDGRHRLIGTVEGFAGDTLYLRHPQNDSPLSIPVEVIRRLERSVGEKNDAGRGAVAGAAIGGLLLGATFSGACESWCEPGRAFVGGLVIGGFSGALVGGAIGSRKKRDRWIDGPRPRVQISAVIAPAPARGGAALLATLHM